MNKNTLQEIEQRAIRDLGMSNWLRARILEIRSRDIVDMMNEVDYLQEVLRGQCEKLMREEGLL